jgi:catechol 2,3-dioxygenase-like lactoylglutathione lyase family enzyme
MISNSSLKIESILLRVRDPDSAAGWLARSFGFVVETCEGATLASRGDCRILFCKESRALVPQSAPEGYYTGLGHIALATNDMPAALGACRENGIRLLGGDEVSHNPGIWGTGMDYVNPEPPFEVALEISRRLDLDADEGRGVPVIGLEHIGIPVADIKKAVSFYEKLGFEEKTQATIRKADGRTIYCAMVGLEGLRLELFEFARMDHEPYSGQAFAALLFRTEDLASLAAYCEAGGLSVSDKGSEGIEITGINGERLRVLGPDHGLGGKGEDGLAWGGNSL